MVYLSNIEVIDPPFFKTQEASLEWLAKLYADNQTAQKYTESDYRKILDRVGADSKSIHQRGYYLPDFHSDKADALIYKKSLKKGAGALARQEFFHRVASSVFEKIYLDREIPSDLIHVSCTGYISPSAAQLFAAKKSQNIVVTHSYHMGCYGAFPAIRIAIGQLNSPEILGIKNKIDIVHTELCTLHLNPEDPSLEQMVIQSLFADGTVVYGLSRQAPTQGFEILSVYDVQIANSESAMQWVISDWGMKMVLSKDVPTIVGKNLKEIIKKWWSERAIDLELEDKNIIWAIHPGGPKILDQVKDILEISEPQMKWSRKVLSERGNMSSATLPTLWYEILKDESLEKGSHIISMAFGPGLTVCLSLMRKI